MRISGGRLEGQGEDSDGIFELVGGYNESGEVRMIRVYTVSNWSPEATGIPYEYIGHWNGEFISGFWQIAGMPGSGDDFEMWPESGESLSISELLRESEPVTA